MGLFCFVFLALFFLFSDLSSEIDKRVVMLVNQSKLGHKETKHVRLQQEEQGTLFSKGFSFRAVVVGVLVFCFLHKTSLHRR